MITEFNCRTGYHTYNEGDVWSEYDGPSYAGAYTIRKGKKIRITKKAVDDCAVGCMDLCEELFGSTLGHINSGNGNLKKRLMNSKDDWTMENMIHEFY